MLENPQDPAEMDTLSFAVGPAIEAVATGKEDIWNHRIPCLKLRYIRTDLCDHSCRFVSHDEGKFRSVPPSIPDVEIRPADSAGPGLDKDIVRTNLRKGDLFDSKRLTNLMEHRCFHFVPSFLSVMKYEMDL